MAGCLPVWANWTAATFSVGAWVQRMVSAVQVKNAQCVIECCAFSRWCYGGCFVGCYSPICLMPLYRDILVVRNRIFS